MDNFNKLMFETLEETVKMVLGENISQLIYPFKQEKTPLKLKEIGNRNDVIITYLEKQFGKEVVQIIQAIAFKRLYIKLKREYEEVENHFVFLDELYEMKFKLLVSSSKKCLPCN